MLRVRDIYFIMINMVIKAKSSYNKVDRSCSCFMDPVSAK
jgi:hypothetical protein